MRVVRRVSYLFRKGDAEFSVPGFLQNKGDGVMTKAGNPIVGTPRLAVSVCQPCTKAYSSTMMKRLDSVLFFVMTYSPDETACVYVYMV